MKWLISGMLCVLCLTAGSYTLAECGEPEVELREGAHLVWTDEVIPYYFEGAKRFPRFAKDSARRALGQWAGSGKVSFVEVNERPTRGITFTWDMRGDKIDQHMLGFAQTQSDGEHLTFSRIVLNAHTYRWPDARLSLDRLMLHEIGHALGMEHSDDPDAVMYPFITSELTAGDKAEFLSHYNGGDK